MEDIKLFISCHKEGIHIPDNKLLYPLQVGTTLAEKRFPGMMHDDEGQNISQKNRSYCELTGQYWVWKNVQADYYGFLHYRRYLNFSQQELPLTYEPFIFGEVVFTTNRARTLRTIQFNEKNMRKVITANDFIAPCAVPAPGGETVYEQYRGSVGHHIEDLDAVIEVLKRDYPDMWPAAQAYLKGKRIYCCNMFIMKNELFQQYSSWLFDILGKHEQMRDISNYEPVDMRVSGYLAERLCGIYITWLYQQGYTGRELQRVYFRDAADGNPYVRKMLHARS